MPASLRFIPGTTIRWRARRFVIVDYAGLDALVAREIGKRRLYRVPLSEAVVDVTPGDGNAWTPDLVSVENKAWQIAVRRFKLLKPLLELNHAERTFAKVNKIAFALGKHPSTIYRWIEDYERTGRLSVFLRKERSDRGKSLTTELYSDPRREAPPERLVSVEGY
jgi:putative transposase